MTRYITLRLTGKEMYETLGAVINTALETAGDLYNNEGAHRLAALNRVEEKIHNAYDVDSGKPRRR